MTAADHYRDITANLNKHCVDVLARDLANKAERLDALTAELEAAKKELADLKAKLPEAPAA
jgi:chromosome segregation ATPase